MATNLMGPTVGQQGNFSGDVIDAQGVEVQRRFVEFLQTFVIEEYMANDASQTSSAHQGPVYEYVDQAFAMKKDEHTTLGGFRHVLRRPDACRGIAAVLLPVRTILKRVQLLIRSIPDTVVRRWRSWAKNFLLAYNLTTVERVRDPKSDKIELCAIREP